MSWVGYTPSNMPWVVKMASYYKAKSSETLSGHFIEAFVSIQSLQSLFSRATNLPGMQKISGNAINFPRHVKNIAWVIPREKNAISPLN